MSDASSLAHQRSVRSSRSSFSQMSVDPGYEADFDLGMRLAVQELYRSDDRVPWTTSIPEKATLDVQAGSYAQECAFLVRRELDSSDPRGSLHSITIQSPLVRDVLHKTFEGYDGLNTYLKQLTFQAPFHAFYYRWPRFEELCKGEQGEEVKTHLSLLHDVLYDEVTPHIETMTDLVKNGVISFDYLWTIFARSMHLYTQADGYDRVMEMSDGRYGASMSGEYFELDCQYIDGDGLSLGYASFSVSISKFAGVKRIVDLDIFPVHLHPNVEKLVSELHARGEKLEQLNGVHHMSYTGTYTAKSSRQTRKRQVERSRIIIDPQTFNVHGPSGPGQIEAGLRPVSGTSVQALVYDASREAFNRYESALEECEARQKGRPSSANLTPKQFMLCTSVVRGFCLDSKSWAEFFVGNVRPIVWNKDAFPRLVLPSGYKEIIGAFVRQQLAHEDIFDDIIDGKGLGFIMLLSGDPGVGKTLTVESVAEAMHQPLYMVNASELGETVTEVEQSLEQILELANKWNAILLLDECDIFLEARSTSNIRRSHLVSVFLRQLEYYRGVMFLTSNRISDFDPAFESRIHLTIHYPALDMQSRLHIWKTFIDTTGSETRINLAQLETLAEIEMNGRQIKNIVKTARLLSKQSGTPLGLDHIEMVLKVKKSKPA